MLVLVVLVMVTVVIEEVVVIIISLLLNMNDDDNVTHTIWRMSIPVNIARATISIELNWKYASPTCK